MGIIQTKDLTHEYTSYDDKVDSEVINVALDYVNIEVQEGEFVAILGHNGSGKSTLARHINALLQPSSGTLWVDGMDTKKDDVWKIRQTVGMVFQNPDNQIIGTIVEEDVGFGPENLGIETSQIWERVKHALKTVNMTAYRKQSPLKLSGGQKQRVAIAGVMAMQPKCIVLDEPTAMLDPVGRKEVLNAIKELNQKEKVTVIYITHYMDEVINADKIYVMDKGKIVMQGKPKEIFSQVDLLKSFGLDVPQVTQLAHRLRQEGVDMPEGILTIEEFAKYYLKLTKKRIKATLES